MHTTDQRTTESGWDTVEHSKQFVL